MSGEWLIALESAAPVAALRNSIWVYPLVNAGHVLGVALLVGAIVPLDLRLLGAWPGVPLAPLWRMLTRVAAAGLSIAIVCGVALFVTDPRAYLASPLFLTKLAIVLVGIVNAVSLRLAAPVGIGALPGADAPVPPRLKAAAAVSTLAWAAALVLGRLVGYF